MQVSGKWIKLFGKRPAHRACCSTSGLVLTRCGIYLNRRFTQLALDDEKHCKACAKDD